MMGGAGASSQGPHLGSAPKGPSTVQASATPTLHFRWTKAPRHPSAAPGSCTWGPGRGP